MNVRTHRRAQRALAAATTVMVVLGLAASPGQAEPAPPVYTPPTAQEIPSVPVTAVKPVVHQEQTVPSAASSPAPIWPAAGRAQVDLPAAGLQKVAPARAGKLPVWVSRPKANRNNAAEVPGRVSVQIMDRASTEKAGVRGVLLRVGRADNDFDRGVVDIAVDYGRFRTAYGGDWASRLRLVALPECALTIPTRRDCGGVPLPSRNDTKAGTVTAEVPVTATQLIALAAGPSGETGDFTATSLQPSSTWSAGGNSGNFSWSYPMRVPPASGGPMPTLDLNYSSQSVDGRHAASNSQPSIVGEGFELATGGFIERSYEDCADDTQGGANNDDETGELCWATDNATLSLGGSSGELIYNATENRWHLRSDDGSRVERKIGADNGDNDGEYWVVTTSGGTQYWFGKNKLPGWSANKPVTKSTWTAPVFSNHATEPCYAGDFDDSGCIEAWRWNLDYVVDVHGNSASYWYQTETNKYAHDVDQTAAVSYVRDGYLDHVAYGTRLNRATDVDNVFTASAPARIDFDMQDRCLSQCGTHEEPQWPDTPWDQECGGSTCDTYSPSFWATKRLASVTTRVWAGSSYTDVERWTFTHAFPDPGDGTRAGLWLSKISHQGLVGTDVTVPDVEFSHVQMANRVDITGDFAAAMKWMRISAIRYESGGTLSVLYTEPDCVAESRMPAAPATNTLRCYPVRWTPEGYDDPVTDYFHKYLVTTVFEEDHTGGVEPKGSPPVVHRYEYFGDPAWHYADDDGLIEKHEKTWSDWRGYAKVGATVGVPGEEQHSENVYFRGMHGDRAASGTRTVTVAGTGVPTVNDEDAYAGVLRESTVYNGDAVVSKKVYEPWRSSVTASRNINGDVVEARFTNTLATHERTTLDGGRNPRVRSTRNTFDAQGMVVAVDDSGDTTVTGDESCTRNTFEPRNTTAWLTSVNHRTQVFALPCGSVGTGSGLTDADVVSDTRYSFDGHSYGVAATRGLVTTTEKATAWNAGNPTWETVGRAAHDATGRATSTRDAIGNETTMAYTPAEGGLVTQVIVTNPLDHEATTTYAPEWGVPTAAVDANDKQTKVAYDGLGRLTAVWLPGRDSQTQTANTTYSYLVSDDIPSAIGTSKLNAAGNYVTSYALFDGLLRPRQTQVPSPAGGRLLTDQFYDSAGRKIREHGYYHDIAPPSTALSTATDRQDVPNQTRTIYDGAGRVTASIFQPYTVERWRTTTSYGGDRTDVTPPAGGTATSTVVDALGRTVAIRQYLSSTPTGSFDATTYTFSRKGQLESVEDPAGNDWAYTYDLRGRQVGASHPDKGDLTSTYDAADRLTSTTDERGIKLQFTYDALNRRTATLQPGVGTRARWTYDTVAKGHLYQSTRFVGSASYTKRITEYDDAYRATKQAFIVPSVEGDLQGTYALANTYNLDGSVSSQDYPAAGGLPLESVSYQYDPTSGLPVSSGSTYQSTALSYVSATVYNKQGQVNQLTLYTGRYTGLGSRVYQYFTHELETGRVTGIRADRESVSPFTLSDAQYRHDPAGNITKIANSAAGDNQCFQHDHLRRLVQAWTPTNADCAAPPSTSGLGGPAPYWQSWTYDQTGNRLTQVDNPITIGGATKTTTYTYPAAGAGPPHAVTGTSTTVGGSTTTGSYTYDVTGNTLTRPTTSSGTQTLTWDPEGRLATSADTTGTTSYLYDADGNRLIRRDPTGSTLYLPGQEVRHTTATDTITCTRYYTFGQKLIASRANSGALTWLAVDHQGTDQVAVDAATQQATIRRQTPFGESRGVATSWPNTKGFVGGIVDNTGLVHLGAREYDAKIGRFVSVDPIQDLADPQQWNPYAYSNNSPITNSDPTGLKFCSDDRCGPGADFEDGNGEYHNVPGHNDGCGGCSGDNTPKPTPPPPPGGPPAPGTLPTPSPSPWDGESQERLQDMSRRAQEMCSGKIIRELCEDAEARFTAELLSWVPYIGLPASIYLIDDAIKYGDYVGAGLEALALIPLGKAGKGLKGVDDVELNKFVGDAYRDHVADFLRKGGKTVITDAEDARLLTFETPHGTRTLDMVVFNNDGSVLGYVEVKSGKEKQKPEQIKKDKWLRDNYGITIDVVYDDLENLLY